MSKSSIQHATKTPSNPMTQEDASRIQSHADKTGRNQEFKQRAQRAAQRSSGKSGKK